MGAEIIVLLILVIFIVFCIYMAIKTSRIKKTKNENSTRGFNFECAPFDIEAEYVPDFPKYPNENTDIAADAYLYDKSGKFLRRADGLPLNDADCTCLMRKGYENAKHKTAEMMGRRLTQSIITDEELNSREQLFFDCFAKKLIENKLNPCFVEINRLSSNAFNVTYYCCYVGKIYIPEKDKTIKYRVTKDGNTRATRVFDALIDAENYILDKENYKVVENVLKNICWMQCLYPNGDAKVFESSDISKMLDVIPLWVKYIKHCMQEYKRATTV